MCNRKFLLLFLFILFQLKAFSAVFVVTSNADSGPGTLRDALTQAAANGTAETDYINFNLPDLSMAGRTITISSQLPDVTGNVVIDGTTQPGAVLGVSNAKIIITVATPVQNLNAFNIAAQIGANDTVELYGFYIEGFTQGGESGINVNSDCKVIVGTPGKGNVICNNWCGFFGDLNNIVIQSNFIGIEPDGETPLPNLAAALAGNYSFNNVLIGGDDPADGNVILGGNNGAVSFGTGTGGNATQNVKIENNFFGTDYKGTTSINNYDEFFINAYVPTITLTVTNNVFSASTKAINVLGVGFSSVTIKGNYFGTDRSQTYQLGTGGEAMYISGFTTATIGGIADVDQNIFTNYDNPILTDNITQAAVIKNSFYCNRIVAFYYTPNNLKITTLLDNEASGDAPAGSMVQLYYTTSSCPNCNPKTWFTTVTADQNGKWDYKGDTRQNIMVSATLNNNTIGFVPLAIAADEVKVINYDCHHKGSLEIIEKRQGRLQVEWKDSKGTSLGSNQKLENLDPGTYTLTINEGGTCPTESGQFTIYDLTPQVYPQSFQLNCNNVTGYFTASATTVFDIGVAEYHWEDDAGNPIASNNGTIKDLPAGKYYLYITDNNGCNSNKALYEVLPAPENPIIDASNALSTDADCDNPNGTITGLIIKNLGDASFGWSKVDGTILNYGQIDLNKAGPGQYYLFIQPNNGCAIIKSPIITINSKNGVTIDESKATTISASCNLSNGSITGIAVSGATQYQWADANGKSYTTTTPDLTNAPSGTYILTASNGNGCVKSSQSYQIDQKAPILFELGMDNSIYLDCLPVITANIKLTAPDPRMKSFRWVNSQNQTIGTGLTVTNLQAGTYQLYITDENGCENYYSSYVVPPYSQFTTTASNEVVNEQCGLKNGSIGAANVAGGIPPYTYKWTDANGTQIGTNNTIVNLSAGTYNLNVTDGACGNITIPYVIGEDSEDLPPPFVSNVQLCSSGSALLSVNNPSATTLYRLYDDANGTQPLAEQTGGRFNVTVAGNRSYFISQLNGTCESSRAEIKVTVGLSTLNIANTFTPNGDGINDYWEISNIENYPNAIVQVFNRYGQKLFESKGYSKPFDGTYSGKKLAAGVYYYIINLSTNCNLLSGSLTIVR
jgi:gliding motility-associated-like protein